MHNKLLIQKINDNARKTLSSINNLQLTDLKVGNYVRFLNDNPAQTSNPLSEEGVWIVVKNDGENLVLVSDLKTSVNNIRASLSTDNNVYKYHPMTVSVFNELNGISIPGNDYYRSSLLFKNYDDMNIDIIDTGLLNEIRESDMDPIVKRTIFNMNGSYVVKNNNYDDPYVNNYEYPEGTMNAYYVYKVYNFSNQINSEPQELERLLNDYCNASSFDKDNKTINYNENNHFGYVDITSGSIKEDGTTVEENNYVDFCYYSSPINYTHPLSDLVVFEEENDINDLITSIKDSNNTLRFRMNMRVDKDDELTPIFIAGGKGISNDPYIITDGVKQS